MDLAGQAVDLLARETPPIQLLVAVAALVLVGLMLQGIASVVRRGERAGASAFPASAADTPRAQAFSPPKTRGGPRRRRVKKVQPARIPRPKVRHRGESGYIGDYVLTVPVPPHSAPGAGEQSDQGIGNWRE
jgi:hypothetical protein